MRKMKRTLAIVLAFVMMFAVLPHEAMARAVSVNVTISGNNLTVGVSAFTPGITGVTVTVSTVTGQPNFTTPAALTTSNPNIVNGSLELTFDSPNTQQIIDLRRYLPAGRTLSSGSNVTYTVRSQDGVVLDTGSVNVPVAISGGAPVPPASGTVGRTLGTVTMAGGGILDPNTDVRSPVLYNMPIVFSFGTDNATHIDFTTLSPLLTIAPVPQVTEPTPAPAFHRVVQSGDWQVVFVEVPGSPGVIRIDSAVWIGEGSVPANSSFTLTITGITFDELSAIVPGAPGITTPRDTDGSPTVNRALTNIPLHLDAGNAIAAGEMWVRLYVPGNIPYAQGHFRREAPTPVGSTRFRVELSNATWGAGAATQQSGPFWTFTRVSNTEGIIITTPGVSLSEIRLPMTGVVKGSGDEAATIRVFDVSPHFSISNAPLAFTIPRGTGTEVTPMGSRLASDHDDFWARVATHHDTLRFGLNVREMRHGSIQTGRVPAAQSAPWPHSDPSEQPWRELTLTAPAGFHWVFEADVAVGDQINLNAQSIDPSGRFAPLGRPVITTPDGRQDQTIRLSANRRVLSIPMTINQSTNANTLAGAFDINTGDLPLILRADSITNPRQGRVYVTVGGNLGVTPGDVYVGTITDWAVNVTVHGDIPELISGRFEATDYREPCPEQHRTATLRISERLYGSWAVDRNTVIEFPEGVTVRKATILTGAANIGNLSADRLTGDFFNEDPCEIVNIRGNQVILRSMTRTGNRAPATLSMRFYLSLCPTFDGPVYATVGGNAIAGTEAYGYSVPVAEAMPPIRIYVEEITPIAHGLQFLPLTSFRIVENFPGALREGYRVNLTISDFIYSELYIDPRTIRHNVAEGDIGVRDFRVATAAEQRGVGFRENVSFEVYSSSSVESEIVFYGIEARLIGAAPLSTRGYYIFVWGQAVAANYIGVHPSVSVMNATEWDRYTRDRSQPLPQRIGDFGYIINPHDLQGTVPGVYAPIARLYVAEGDPPAAGRIRESMIIQFDSNTMVVDGEEITLELPAQRIDGVGLIPLRSIMDGLDLEVRWDPAISTAFIDPDGLNLHFTSGNSIMWIDGVPHPIMTGEGATAMPTAPTIVDGRMFIPLRAFAFALGLNTHYANGTITFTPF